MKIPLTLPDEAWQTVKVFAAGLAKEPAYALLGFVCFLVFLLALVLAGALIWLGAAFWAILVIFGGFVLFACVTVWRAPTIIRIGIEARMRGIVPADPGDEEGA